MTLRLFMVERVSFLFRGVGWPAEGPRPAFVRQEFLCGGDEVHIVYCDACLRAFCRSRDTRKRQTSVLLGKAHVLVEYNQSLHYTFSITLHALFLHISIKAFSNFIPDIVYKNEETPKSRIQMQLAPISDPDRVTFLG